MNFQKLTPTKNVDLTVYEDAINFVFENNDIKNVAISGAYSSGKSSVLCSYAEKYQRYRFLNISLAHFEKYLNYDSSDADANKNLITEKQIEGKILNQLIHQINPKEIPLTKFNVKNAANKNSLMLTTAILCITLISFLHIAFFDQWRTFIHSINCENIQRLFYYSTVNGIQIIGGIIIFVALFFGIYNFIKLQKNNRILKKLSIKGNEIELFENNDDSYFDRYLDEILYLFNNCGADVIVFEDIDRFNNHIIFEKLREINTLLNKKSENSKLIRFFYLIKDDIFVTKDRTKFFDYIIPIVPVVDSSNSYDKFLEIFDDNEILNSIDKSFLQGLSLYIDDLRILKNIYNEFIIYYNKLKAINLNKTKMLAIIVYKNLFPCDFSELQLSKGFMYSIFSNKEMLINKELNDITFKIKNLRNEILFIDDEVAVDLHEINIIFSFKKLGNYNLPKNNNDAFDKRVEELLKNDTEYIKRVELIKSKKSDLINGKELQIKELTNKKSDLLNKKLYEVITRENIDEYFRISTMNEVEDVFDYKQIKRSDYFQLLKYLIRNGYIDESYQDYMTYFYPNSISINDKRFLRGIADKVSNNFNYKLDNPQLIIERLQLVNFSQKEVLNFDLLSYLLKSNFTIQLEEFIKQLKHNHNIEFIYEFLGWIESSDAIVGQIDIIKDKEEIIGNFVKTVNNIWSKCFYEMIHSDCSTIFEYETITYALETLYNSDESIIKKVNDNNCLKDYISNYHGLLEIKNINSEAIKRGFSLLNIKIKSLYDGNINDDLLELIYNGNYYVIDKTNVEILLRRYYESYDNLWNEIYTIIISKIGSPMYLYIHKNISSFVDLILSLCGEYICDEEDAVIQILNNDEIKSEQKFKYINCLTTTIIDISFVKDFALYKQLLENRNVLYTPNNIMYYFIACNKKIDDTLIQFINYGTSMFKTSVFNSFGHDLIQLFSDELIVCDKLNDDKYENLILALGYSYKKFAIIGVSKSKISILIKYKIIKMNVDTLKFMRENYAYAVLHFIKVNFSDYLRIMSEDLASIEEVKEILNWKISDDKKLQLLHFTNEPISVKDKSYNPRVINYILENNLDSYDLEYLFRNYDNYSISVLTTIKKIAKENISIVIEYSSGISKALMNELLCDASINIDDRIDLYVCCISRLSSQENIEYLQVLDVGEFTKVFDSNTRPKYKINPVSDKVLTAFKKNDIIYGFKEDSSKPNYYRIWRKRPTKRLF